MPYADALIIVAIYDKRESQYYPMSHSTGHPALPGGLFCAIGNPLSDGTWTYTWEKGRQLKQLQSVDTTASFIYGTSITTA